jgi:hypothetical protein
MSSFPQCSRQLPVLLNEQIPLETPRPLSDGSLGQYSIPSAPRVSVLERTGAVWSGAEVVPPPPQAVEQTDLARMQGTGSAVEMAAQ